MDPAGPIIGMYGPNKRLDSQDAQCVDIWHTSHELGIKYDLGDMDFYPNGGDNQPSCDEADFTAILTGTLIFNADIFIYTILVGNKFTLFILFCFYPQEVAITLLHSSISLTLS